MGLISLSRIENVSPHATWNDSVPPGGTDSRGFQATKGIDVSFHWLAGCSEATHLLNMS